MRILTVATRLEAIGGLELAQLEACRQLRARGHRIDLLFVEPGDLSAPWSEITDRRVRVRSYALYRRAPLGSVVSAAGVVAAVRRLAPDVVYVHHHHHTLAPALAGKPLICHMHLPPPPDRSRQDEFALRRSRGLIAVSRFTAGQWSESLELPSERFEVVANGVDLARFSPADAAARISVRATHRLPADRFLILYAGRVDSNKGIEVALETIERLDPGEFHLAIAGESNPGSFGGDTAAARAYSDQLRARHDGSAVTWLGRLKDASHVLAAADAVILPSLFPDPLPLIVLETLASGTPIVASAVGGIPEMLTGPLAANLAHPGDAGAFAERLRALRDWRTSNPELGRLGREHVERNFTLDRMGYRVNDAIERAMLGQAHA